MRRALLIGVQSDGLSGVHADLAAMQALLSRYAFVEQEVLVDAAADRAGILAAIERLIDRCAPGDAAALYYSGHGWRVDVPDDQVGDGPASYQGICPWDARATRDDDFRGILAEELSALLVRLTEKTDNVTAILDCCHATGAVRTDVARPRPGVRALPVPWTAGVARLLAELRPRYPLERRDPECNPLAVRLLACSPHERAYEAPDGAGGLLTRALVDVLAACGHAEVVWEDLARRVRERVLERREQHPVALGPIRRHLFATDARAACGSTAYVRRDGRHYLLGGALTGQRVGDRFAALPLAPAPGRVTRGGASEPLPGALARLEVVAVEGSFSLVRVEPADAALPDGTPARPCAWGRPRGTVVVDVRSAWRPAVAATLALAGLLRPIDAPGSAAGPDATAGDARRRAEAAPENAAGPDAEPLASIVEVPGGLVALDGEGLPLCDVCRVAGDDDLAVALARLRAVIAAAAQVDALRRLLPVTPLDRALRPFAVAWSVGEAGRLRPLGAGERVHAGARVSVHVRNTGGWPLYASVLLAGPGGAVRLLSSSQPAGVELMPGASYRLGDPGLTGVEGVAPGWPAGLPRAERRATLVAVVSDAPVDLRAWETDEPPTRSDRPQAPTGLAPLQSATCAIERLEVVLAPASASTRGG